MEWSAIFAYGAWNWVVAIVLLAIFAALIWVIVALIKWPRHGGSGR